jgi:metal-responsive CopG/Arc/MetJ family transcriptional regulator
MYTYIMHRTQIYLSDEQVKALNQAAKRERRSRSDLIRDAIDHTYIEQRRREERIRELMESAGAWSEREYDGEQFVECIRTGARLKRLYPDDQTTPG